MPTQSPNFGFLAAHDALLVKYAALAELSVFTDPNGALVKLRQLCETLAATAAAHHGVDIRDLSQANVLQALANRNVLPDAVRNMFHEVRIAGNDAVHNHLDDARAALRALRQARIIAVWFHKAYGLEPGFKGGPFIPPPQPVDASQALRHELEQMRAELAEARRKTNAAIESAQDAEARREQAEAEAKAAFEDAASAIELAAETEAALDAERARVEQNLTVIRDAAAAAPAQERNDTETRAHDAALDLELDETDTRILIDAQLRACGWEVDSAAMRYAAGVRPQKGKSTAIAEWPTASGPADYVLFHGLTPIAIVEAKRAAKNVPSALIQAERYSTGFQDTDDVRLAGDWNGIRVPFLFATNGRSYIKQLIDKSGVHFRDARDPTNTGRALPGWYAPADLAAELDKPVGKPERRDIAEQFSGVLRPYQREAVTAVENAIDAGKRLILLAMATGTGKTRTAICLAYRLIQSGRFRRILFLVDRSALGDQATDSFGELPLEQHQAFTSIYGFEGMDVVHPQPETRLHIATVQGMVYRVVNTDDGIPAIAVSAYDCVIIDECHRGYNLDRELSDAELTFRSEADYISKYRRVIEHFDAVRIGLTATPALHTKEIFGPPAFQYGYRRAVIEGHLCDYDPPVQIVTKLARDGIHWEAGSKIPVYKPKKLQVELFETPDEVDFELGDFNRNVLTENFNRAVCTELARQIDPTRPGKTMVFCATDEHADLFVRVFTEELQAQHGKERVPARTVLKITGAADKPRQLLREYKNERLPNVAVTVDLLTTGVDVPEICNLVFMRRVRSRILYEQMIGRATRRCPEIDKTVFRIYDAVDLYTTLQDHSDMRPVVTQPKVTFEQLAGELVELVTQGEGEHTDDAITLVCEQLTAKMQRKRKALEAPANQADFEVLAGSTPAAVFELLQTGTPAEVAGLLSNHPRLAPWLDKLRSGIRPPVYISDHLDEIVEVARGYGGGKKPEDYLDAFRDFIAEHANDWPALIAVTQRPRSLTRAELKELRLRLDEAGYSENSLRLAYRDTTNQDIAASIVGYIRRAALGDPLVSYEERVKRALSSVLGGTNWTVPQRQWLERIGKQLIAELIVDRDALNDGQFKHEGGGFNRLNKTFDGRLQEVLDQVADKMWG